MRPFSFVVEFDLHDGYCRKERASSCCQLVSQTNRETGQWDDGRSLRPIVLLSNRQQVPPNDKRRVSIISRKGHFGNWFKEKEAEWRWRQWGLHKEMKRSWSIFAKWGQVKALFCLTSSASCPQCFPPRPHPTFNSLNCLPATPLSVCMLTVDIVFAGNKITVHFIATKMIFDGISTSKKQKRLCSE